MKFRYFRYKGLIASAIPALLLVALLAGCDSEVTQEDIDEQKQNVAREQEKLEALKERQQVEDTMESKLTSLQTKIDQLEKQADEAKEDAEVQLRGEIARLRTKYEQAQDRLKELRAASGDKWAQLKIKTEEAWKDVSESVDARVKEWKKDAGDSGADDNQSNQ